MNFHQTQQLLKTILNPFGSASLVTEDGKLLASADTQILKSTTSRLVVLQIIKKYLNPQVGDLFILNDPENGGLNYQNIFFITRLTEKLFLVFVKEIDQINFKIPPTPLFDKGLKNKTVWPFLVDQNPHANILSDFFEKSWNSVHELKSLTAYLSEIAITKNQVIYFKIVSQILEQNFNTRAIGQNETLAKLTSSESVKLKLTIDEKQNQRSIHADFSQTSSAGKISAASHIVESALVATISDIYGMTGFLSQPVLDLIRLSLPPQSMVSKAHLMGSHNLLLQKIVTEQVTFLLAGLNRKNKAVPAAFQLSPEFHVELQIEKNYHLISADAKKLVFKDFDYLIKSQKVSPLMMQQIDGNIKFKFKIETTENISVHPKLILHNRNSDFMTISGASINQEKATPLKKNDIVELNWNLVK